MLKPDAILETALYVSDLDAAHQFYAGILNLEEVLHVPGRHRFYGCGPGMLLLFVAEATRQASGPFPTHGADGPGHMCFRVSSEALDAWRAHLEASGLDIEADFKWPTGARSIYVRDPDNNSVEFSEPLLWRRPE